MKSRNPTGLTALLLVLPLVAGCSRDSHSPQRASSAVEANARGDQAPRPRKRQPIEKPAKGAPPEPRENLRAEKEEPEPQETSTVFVPLDALANMRIDHFGNPPKGVFQGKGKIPFNLDRAIGTQAAQVNERPVSATLNVSIKNPRAVHILINGYWMLDGQYRPTFIGKEVGNIRLLFSDGGKTTHSLVAWGNLRETWQRVDAFVEIPKHLDGNVTLSEMQTEDQGRGAIRARATLDMLTIQIPAEHRRSTLTAIEINDTSTETVNSPDPGLMVSGISASCSKQPERDR